jgi:hypothetical protein
MVVGFTTTCAIRAYHHQSCEFEPRSCRGVLDAKFVSDLRHVGGFLRVLLFLPPIKLAATIYIFVDAILLKVALNAINQSIR